MSQIYKIADRNCLDMMDVDNAPLELYRQQHAGGFFVMHRNLNNKLTQLNKAYNGTNRTLQEV